MGAKPALPALSSVRMPDEARTGVGLNVVATRLRSGCGIQ